MLIAILADTHLPRGSRALPQACLERVRAADLRAGRYRIKLRLDDEADNLSRLRKRKFSVD